MVKKKRKFRFARMHPITSIILLTLLVMILSSILSLFQIQTTYSTIGANNNLDSELVAVEGLFNFDGILFYQHFIFIDVCKCRFDLFCNI